MTEERKTTTKGIKKHRSPNYPYTGLEDALEKTRQIQEHGRTFFVPFTVAMDAWGYKAAGTTHSVIAALKAYGLIEVQGEGEKKEIKVSESGRKILDDHSEHGALLKEVALRPTLHRELWEKYEGNLPPSNKLISEHLKYKRNFNPTTVDGFIEQFRATIAFARLTEFDLITSAKEDTVDNLGGLKQVEKPSNTETKAADQTGFDHSEATTLKEATANTASVANLPPEGGSEIKIHVSPAGEIQMVFSGVVTKDSLDLLQGVLKMRPDIFEKRLEPKAKEPMDKNETESQP